MLEGQLGHVTSGYVYIGAADELSPTEAAKRKAPDGPGSSGASEGDHLQVES
jgi:hypothetical protein